MRRVNALVTFLLFLSVSNTLTSVNGAVSLGTGVPIEKIQPGLPAQRKMPLFMAEGLRQVAIVLHLASSSANWESDYVGARIALLSFMFIGLLLLVATNVVEIANAIMFPEKHEKEKDHDHVTHTKEDPTVKHEKHVPEDEFHTTTGNTAELVTEKEPHKESDVGDTEHRVAHTEHNVAHTEHHEKHAKEVVKEDTHADHVNKVIETVEQLTAEDMGLEGKSWNGETWAESADVQEAIITKIRAAHHAHPQAVALVEHTVQVAVGDKLSQPPDEDKDPQDALAEIVKEIKADLVKEIRTRDTRGGSAPEEEEEGWAQKLLKMFSIAHWGGRRPFFLLIHAVMMIILLCAYKTPDMTTGLLGFCAFVEFLLCAVNAVAFGVGIYEIFQKKTALKAQASSSEHADKVKIMKKEMDSVDSVDSVDSEVPNGERPD